MQFTLALLGLASSAAAQAVTAMIPPSTSAPSGCLNSRQGSFKFTTYKVTGSSKRELGGPLEARQQDLEITLVGGVLTDSLGRTGYIASNNQFQFDKPPQHGAIYTSGWSICSNGSLALGDQLQFWQCKSGSFFNLYNTDAFPVNCNPVTFNAAEGAGSDYSTTVTALGGNIASMSGASTPATSAMTSMMTTSMTMPASNATVTMQSPSSMMSASSAASNPAAPSAVSHGAAGSVATVAPQALFAGAFGLLGALALA